MAQNQTPNLAIGNSRNTATALNNNSMVKSHQQIAGVYSNLGPQQKTQTSGGKFLSKSPNPQNKMMANTNYGKFKGANGLPVNSVYTRNQGIGGQYLPKLAGGAQSQAQLPGAQTHLQQQLLQQSSSSQLQNSYQRPKNSIQPSVIQNVHASSQQSIKSVSAVGNPVKTSQAINFRQNLNISLQQIAKVGSSSQSKSTSQGPKQGSATNAYRNTGMIKK